MLGYRVEDPNMRCVIRGGSSLHTRWKTNVTELLKVPNPWTDRRGESINNFPAGSVV